jgi:prepilin-type N-terminal cleavage/methylation domain-containing protein
MRSENGFTLVELIMSLTLLSVIMGPLTGAVIIGLRTADGTNQKLSDSHDEQLVATYLVKDVQSASTVSTTDVSCGTAGVVVARLSWADPDGTAKAASYRVDAGTVVRNYCENGSLRQGFPVAHGLGSAQIACAPSCMADWKTLTMTVTEASGYSFAISASRRGTPS